MTCRDTWANPGLILTALMFDDGFYYAKIAQHVARGDGSTFDGIHPTSGYHPLWMLCLVPIHRMISAPSVAVILGSLLQALFLAAVAGLTYATARLRLG